MPGYKSFARAYFFLSTILVGLIFAHYFHFLKKIDEIWRFSLAPVLSNSYSFSVRVGEVNEFFKNRDEFLTDYQKVKTELTRLQTIEAKHAVVSEENNELRQQLHFQKNTSFTLTLASVIGHNLSDLEKTILINRGSADGLQEQLPVVAADGVLVGKIAAVFSHTALVRLIDDPRSKVAVTVLSTQRSIGIVESGFGVSLQMTGIPRNESLPINTQIVTSGLEDFIPRGLLIGTVSAVQNEAYQPFQQAVITPALDATKLSVVSVIMTRNL